MEATAPVPAAVPGRPRRLWGLSSRLSVPGTVGEGDEPHEPRVVRQADGVGGAAVPAPGAQVGPLSAGGRSAFTASGLHCSASLDKAAMALSPSRLHPSHRGHFKNGSAVGGGEGCPGQITALQETRVEERPPPRVPESLRRAARAAQGPGTESVLNTKLGQRSS